MQPCYRGRPGVARVQYRTSSDAAQAFHSVEAVLNNRFIRVYYAPLEEGEAPSAPYVATATLAPVGLLEAGKACGSQVLFERYPHVYRMRTDQMTTVAFTRCSAPAPASKKPEKELTEAQKRVLEDYKRKRELEKKVSFAVHKACRYMIIIYLLYFCAGRLMKLSATLKL